MHLLIRNKFAYKSYLAIPYCWLRLVVSYGTLNVELSCISSISTQMYSSALASPPPNPPVQFQNTLFKDLPQWMLDCLGLRAGEEYLIPKHLHLFRTALIGFGGRKSSEGERDLILHAPPPRHFLETAEALNLRYSQLPAHALTLLRFLLLLPASEAASHTVPFITSAYSTNLLSGRAGDEATQVQQISELRASLALPKKRSRVKAWFV